FDPTDRASVYSLLDLGFPAEDLPMPAVQASEAACREARALSDEIFDSYNTLHAILQRHEETLRRRWCKRNQEQRRKVVLGTWPDMAPTHRPDFHAWRRELEAAQDKDKSPKYRDYYLLPYINQEDLVTKQQVLPLLLNSRGRHPPSCFAARDHEAMRVGLEMRAIRPVFVAGFTMLLNGLAENTRQYGELLSWKQHRQAAFLAVRRKQFHVGDGLLVLEAQARVLSFLVNCCRQLLQTIPDQDLLADHLFPILPEPPDMAHASGDGFAALTVLAAEAPYRPPAQLDLGRMESLLAARTAAAEDHLWALREDPDYFAKTLHEVKEHRAELRDNTVCLEDERCPAGEAGQSILLARTLGHTVHDACTAVEVFSDLTHQAQELIKLQSRYEQQQQQAIPVTQNLLEKFLTPLLFFKYSLLDAAGWTSYTLLHALPAAPSLRRFLVAEPDGRGYSLRSVPKMRTKELYLFFLFELICKDPDTVPLAGTPILVDELERLLECEPALRDLLSPYIQDTVSNLSILMQCLNQLAQYQPWARSWEVEMRNREREFRQEYARRTRPWNALTESTRRTFVETHPPCAVVRLGDPARNHFAYPVTKPRNRKNVETLRRAEARLDAFWALADQGIAFSVDRGPASYRLLFEGSRTLQRTPAWEEPEPAPAQADPPANLDAAEQFHSHPPLPLTAPSSQPPTENLKSTLQPPLPARINAKTRGAPRPSQEEAGHPNPSADDAPDDRTIPVNVRAYQTFRMLFFDLEVTSRPGEIPWNDFLHAMVTAGFTAMKLYGSVWQFEPSWSQARRSIQFHEPHLRGKLSFTAARRFGRRLYRAYGWHGGLFVL
ncbi:uncharacterized protein BP01DRAFT_278053, partial [Aspergillus saccharolyticus JOP 1030-1]